MTAPTSRITGCERTERVADYVLEALPASERSAFEKHLDECAERHHLAGGVARFEFKYVSGLATEGGVGLRGHLVSPAKQVEIIHVKGTEINLERVENITQADAH